MSNGLPMPDLGANWTPLTRNVLIGLFLAYVAQLLSHGVAEQLLGWQPFAEGFRPWQVLTHIALGSSVAPWYTVLDWVVIFFVLAPLDGMLGRRGLVGMLAATWAVGTILAAVGMALNVTSGAYWGLSPLLASMVSVFGFMLPNTVFRLFFVLPVRAIWISWGTGLLSFLFLLAWRDTGSALTFFGWVGSTAWFALWRTGGFRRWQLLWKKRQVEKKLARFEVIDGGRTDRRPPRSRDPNDWVH